MQIILRALLYIWLLTGFSASYFLVIDLDTTTENQIGGMGWFPVVWMEVHWLWAGWATQ